MDQRVVSIVARVLHVDLALARVRYELLDLDGSQLGEPVSAMFDQSWWQFFRPFHHRIG
jgi:hypothetical protein